VYELAPYEPAHRDDYLRLLRAAWGDAAMRGEEFDWWFGRNPAGSLMSVARSDGRIVGVASHSLTRMQLAGQERLGAFSVHATTDASVRGQGIFPALERRHEEQALARGVAVVLAFASKPTEPIFRGTLGWRDVGRLLIWARPFPRLRRAAADVGRITRFTHVDDAAAAWPNHVIRDAGYLNWRYAESPKGYELLGSESGYAVLGHKLHRGQPIALVADLVAREPRTLLRASARAVRRGTHLLFALPAPEQRAAYALAGFAPTPMTLHFMGKALAGRLNPDPRAWRFTLGDTDFF
jgi:GNAT superfamily N-acetyltransferase